MACRIGAHRGWTAQGPENSTAALVAAAAVADFAELDVRRSVDGVAVLSHDPEVAGLVVAESTAAALASVGVATLAEVLAAVGDLPLDIEVKPDVDPAVLDEVCRTARPIDWVTSFDWALVDTARGRRPDLATGLLVDEGWDLDRAVEAAMAAGHRFVLPHHSMVVGPITGVDVAVWTVNDPSEAGRLVDYGVAAVISDRPDLLREVCR